LFKKQNKKIVKKRYINCKIADIFESMQSVLQSKIPQENLTSDVIYFVMGITGLKRHRNFPCSKEVKTEIENFLE